jgi:PAS domain S-box-containing protein
MSALDSLHARLPLAVRILLSIAFAALSVLLRFALLPIDAGLVCLTFYPVVVVTFCPCGPGPCVLNVLLGGIGGQYFFSQPCWGLDLSSNAVMSLLVFSATSALIGLVVVKLKSANAADRTTLQALALNEGQYQAIVEDQTDLICRFRADGQVVYVNDAHCSYFGSSSDDIVMRETAPLCVSRRPSARRIRTGKAVAGQPGGGRRKPGVLCRGQSAPGAVHQSRVFR